MFKIKLFLIFLVCFIYACKKDISHNETSLSSYVSNNKVFIKKNNQIVDSVFVLSFNNSLIQAEIINNEKNLVILSPFFGLNGSGKYFLHYNSISNNTIKHEVTYSTNMYLLEKQMKLINGKLSIIKDGKVVEIIKLNKKKLEEYFH